MVWPRSADDLFIQNCHSIIEQIQVVLTCVESHAKSFTRPMGSEDWQAVWCACGVPTVSVTAFTASRTQRDVTMYFLRYIHGGKRHRRLLFMILHAPSNHIACCERPSFLPKLFLLLTLSTQKDTLVVGGLLSSLIIAMWILHCWQSTPVLQSAATVVYYESENP